MIFTDHPAAMDGFVKYCNASISAELVCDEALINWFVEVIRVLESPATKKKPLLSMRFEQFIKELMP
jgi:hypothetical protein